jgi:hypothetical protein
MCTKNVSIDHLNGRTSSLQIQLEFKHEAVSYQISYSSLCEIQCAYTLVCFPILENRRSAYQF